MKRLSLYLFVSLLLTGFCSVATAQSIVNMNFTQNPEFGVSTNDVSATINGSDITIGGDVVVTGGSGVYTYRWYQGDKELGTASTLTIGKTGEYYLDIKDQCDCLQTVVFHITGTDDIDAIELNDIRQITVFDSEGRLVKVINDSQLDLSGLPVGLYIINKVDKNGKVAVSKTLNK